LRWAAFFSNALSTTNQVYS